MKNSLINDIDKLQRKAEELNEILESLVLLLESVTESIEEPKRKSEYYFTNKLSTSS